MASTPKSWTWTGQRIKAAQLVAEDALSNERIAEEVGIHLSTFKAWKQVPEFESRVREIVQELDEAVSQLRFAKRRERIRALNEQAEDYVQIRKERSAYFAEKFPNVPGGRTGRLVHREEWVGTAKDGHMVDVFEVDGGTDKLFDSVLIQIAKERNEWTEGKRELTGPNGTPLLPIVEIEITHPVEGEGPADDDDD